MPTLSDISGQHWTDDPWNFRDDDYDLARPFGPVLQIIYQYGLQEYHLQRQLDHIKRLHQDGHDLTFRLTASPWENETELARRWAPIIRSLLPFGQRFQILNEVNDPIEGWLKTYQKAEDIYETWALNFLREIRRLVPEAKFGSTPMSPNFSDLTWYAAIPNLLAEADFFCCHVYWQYENWASPDAGQRYKRYLDLTNKDVFITEYADTTPNKSSREQATTCQLWLNTIANEQPRIRACHKFILASSNQLWKDQIIDSADLPLLLTKTQIEGEPPVEPTTITDARLINPALFAEWNASDGPDKAIRRAFARHFCQITKSTDPGILLDITDEAKEVVCDYTEILRPFFQGLKA